MNWFVASLGQWVSAVYALLDEKQWAALSAVGTVLQALIALAALFYVGAQLRAGRKTADLQALQELFRAVTEREKELFRSRHNSDEQDAAFLEFMNFLELQAAALHGGLVARYPRKILKEKIVDSLALVATLPEWQERFMAAKSSETTFEHLRRFGRKNRKAIKRVEVHMRTREKTVTKDGPNSVAG